MTLMLNMHTYEIFEMNFFPFLNIFQCFLCDRLPRSCSLITKKNDYREKITTEKNKEMNSCETVMFSLSRVVCTSLCLENKGFRLIKLTK